MSDILYTSVKGEYLRNNPTWQVEDSAWKAKQVMKMIDRHNLSISHVAEIGCGAGEVLNQLHSSLPENVIFTGYEISPDAFEFCKTREKERLHYKLENLLQSNEKYDLLLIMDVIEHVEDVFTFLRSCKTQAEYKILHIPLDISIHSILRNRLMGERTSNGHLHYFTMETALATLKECDYKILDFFYTLGAIELPRKTFKSKLSVLPRKIMHRINPDKAALWLGGYSLLVFAK